jgi:hypothetical protein
VLRRRAAEGKRPHSVDTTQVCWNGSVDSQFFPHGYPVIRRRESYAQLLGEAPPAQFMPGSSVPMLNPLEFRSMVWLRRAKRVAAWGVKRRWTSAGGEARAAHSADHSCHKLFSVAVVIFDCQG